MVQCLLGKEGLEGLERAGEVEVFDRRAVSQTSSWDHLAMHADSGSCAVPDSGQKNQNVGGEPSSPETAPRETRERAPEVKSFCKCKFKH